ncbi:hypothetical protein PV325_011128, partial [Microctonus aethiopoides]
YDLVSVEAKYHGKCFSNFVLVKGQGDAGRSLDENIKIAMENVFHYIENNDDCQFTLAEFSIAIFNAAARRSCGKAAADERKLVLNQLDELAKEMPMEIKYEFTDVLCNVGLQSNPNFDKTLGAVVNIIVSYDMGWSKRGNGRSDSLNGYGAIIGLVSKKILDYRTRNQKCRSCDLGRPTNEHDCRKNFTGSAKAMEADVGAELLTRSTILKETNLNVKIVVGDEDSSLMSA